MRSSNYEIHLNGTDKLQQVLEAVSQCPLDGSIQITIKKLPKTRTVLQNRALHKWCSLLADELNAGGYSVQTTLSQAVQRDWDMDGVKSLLWRPIQLLMTGKESTAEAERADYGRVYETLNRFLGEKFGVHVPWPEDEDKRRRAA